MPQTSKLQVSTITETSPDFSLTEKLVQGLGGMVQAIHGGVFMLILFYYNTILGVPAHWVGAVLALTVIIDAVSDPLIGSWSDNTTHSNLGRRHPFMFAAILPLGLTFIALMAPPTGLGLVGLLIWLLVFGMACNISFTLFQIPFLALLGELTDDYDVRTKLSTYRYGAFLIGAIVGEYAIYTLFLPDSEAFPQGQFNAGGYPQIGVAAALACTIVIFVTTQLTRNRIPYLPKVTAGTKTSFIAFYLDMKSALSNRNFRLLFCAILFASISFGTVENMGRQMSVFFWGLNSEAQGKLAVGGLGALLAIIGTAYLQKFFEKRTLILTAFIIFFSIETIMVSARFMGVLPPNGSDALLILLIIARSIRVGAIVLAAIYYASLLGDIVREHEHHTGKNQSGSMYAGLSFAEKAITGLGVGLAGLILSAASLPAGDITGAIAATPTQIRNLGLAYGFLIPALGIIPLLAIGKIDLTRARLSSYRT